MKKEEEKEKFLNIKRDQVTVDSNIEYLIYLNMLELQKINKNLQRNTEILEKWISRKKK